MTRVLQIGNFKPINSTENDLRDALVRLDVEVEAVQESEWVHRQIELPNIQPDLVLWTRTRWDGQATPEDVAAQLDRYTCPRVAYHLDRWSGLRRMADIYTDPYWRKLTRFYTADPQIESWQRLGIDAVLTPPAVSERWLTDPDPVPRYNGIDVAFVGNWHKAKWTGTDWDGYHVEHQHRWGMLDELTGRYGRRFNVYPTDPAKRIIGQELAELYVSVPVIVGDSCLVGLDAYLSDRIPETIGRGGFLIHPWTHWNDWYVPGEHLECFRPYDWQDMFGAIDRALEDDDYRQTVAAQGAAHVRKHHTYTHRMAKVLEEMV